MTAKQFMLEMELFEYSKENFELTKLVNQIELQEMALNARDAIKYNDLNEEALAYISETVEAANLKVEYFSEGKDDDKKEDGFFKKLWANIVKFWKWIWGGISTLFTNIGNWIAKVFKVNEEDESVIEDAADKITKGKIKIEDLSEAMQKKVVGFLKKHGLKFAAAGIAIGTGAGIYNYVKKRDNDKVIVVDGQTIPQDDSILMAYADIANHQLPDKKGGKTSKLMITDGGKMSQLALPAKGEGSAFYCTVDGSKLQSTLNRIITTLDNSLKIKKIDPHQFNNLAATYDKLKASLMESKNTPSFPKSADVYNTLAESAKEAGRKCKEMVSLIDVIKHEYNNEQSKIKNPTIVRSEYEGAYSNLSKSLKALHSELTDTIKLLMGSVKNAKSSHSATVALSRDIIQDAA